MILKYISTKIKRVKYYETEIWLYGSYCNNMVGMSIEFKVFGLFWFVGKQYTYDYFKN